MRRMVSILLCVAALLTLMPMGALAVESGAPFAGSEPAESVEFDSPSYALTAAELEPEASEIRPMSAFDYKPMASSQKLVDLIKDCEGFASKPYWDYGHWAIGYGTTCGYRSDGSDVPSEYWDGISEAKGQELLMAHIENIAEAEVNKFFKRIGRQPLQQQFDAIVDFTYALGSGWMYEDSRVAAWLENPTTELELMRALGAWCRISGKVSTSTGSRRIREALIYLYGMYLLPNGTVNSDLPVVHNGELPVFRYVVYEGNGTTLINERTDDINYYFADQPYGSLLTPSRQGYTFGGWQYEGGSLLLEGHRVKSNVRVKALWTKMPFTDVPNGKWYTTPVAYCSEKNLMYGVSGTSFDPSGNTTRAMVVTVLYRMAGSPKVSGGSGLSDVVDGSYYADAVVWAVQNGVVAGYADGSFRPRAAVSRQEMVTFLCRYARQILGADVSASDQTARFRDGDQVSGYARDAINWAVARGIISGTGSDGTYLAPRDQASRAQLAKLLMCLDNLEK